ncbi:segregation and condensation protein A [Arcanobacterium ihumii]|uniref:segregation and condensation protein A n=1 Tax=Arcanobacterium ihumii TaxID=2138162 RepID=UPI0013593D64|nr:ScpA family protein [Arcanobacterium ihumii]
MAQAHNDSLVQDDLFAESRDKFAVDLDIFQGPFDVLLSLIARHRLDITEVALAQVTDDFLAFVSLHDELDLSQASEFLVVAATLLDLKAARLLPHSEDDPETLELLEARDLLFAKLLQYKAFKDVATDIFVRMERQGLAFAREVDLEPQFKKMLPELQLNADRTDLAIFAARAFSRKADGVTLDHLHDPLVSVDSQVTLIREKLIVGDRISFLHLCEDAQNVPTVVSRFLAILELIRSGEIKIEQDSPLGSLIIHRISPAKSASSLLKESFISSQIPSEKQAKKPNEGSASAPSESINGDEGRQ